jgi:hypothetical protein
VIASSSGDLCGFTTASVLNSPMLDCRTRRSASGRTKCLKSSNSIFETLETFDIVPGIYGAKIPAHFSLGVEAESSTIYLFFAGLKASNTRSRVFSSSPPSF